MTGHVNGGGEMISGSGRHGDKSVGALSGGGAEARAYETGRRGDQLPTARASFVSSLLGIAGIDQILTNFAAVERVVGTVPLRPLCPQDLRSRITIALDESIGLRRSLIDSSLDRRSRCW